MLHKIKQNPKLGVIILAYLAYVALGMPDGVLGIAWPSMRISFSMPLDAVGMLLSAFVVGYLTSSFLSGVLISRFGVGIILATSCATTGIGLIGYTLVPYWWMMIALGVIAGLGSGAIDSSLNTYVAAHFNEKLMQWLHASYGIGITIGPIIMTITLTTLNSWKAGYLTVGSFQLILAVCFVLTLSMWGQNNSSDLSDQPKKVTDYKTPLGETLRQPKVLLSSFLFFLYVGCEVSLGTWAYTLLIESRGIQREAAAIWAGSYWATFTIGRILAGLYIKRVGNNLIVSSSIILSILGSALLWWNPISVTNLISVSLIGFAIAPIFPAMMSATSQRVGEKFTANTIGMQMSAGILGASIIPSIVGVLARQISLEIIPVCMMVLFSILFGFYMLSSKIVKNIQSTISL